MKIYAHVFKRPLDIVLPTIGLILLSPLFWYLSRRIAKEMGKPVIYKQQRAGFHGKPFYIYKFRTMTNEKDGQGQLLPDKDRITPLGNFLRKSSLDELPELWNVLKGEMSLIGPRPLLMDYLPYYTAAERHRHDMRPGLSGWAQVNGRNAIDWAQKLQLDLDYVKRVSFWVDLRVIFLTLLKVVKASDIDQSDNETMERFDDWRNAKK